MRKIYQAACLLPLLLAYAGAQTGQAAPPVAYSSVSQLNMVLSQVQQASQAIQSDLGKTRIDKWKTDSGTKRQSQADAESIQRNLQTALPEIIAKLQNSPESLPQTFELYRNLDALYDVFGSMVESAGAFGSKDDFQALQNDLGMLERSRHALADRMNTLANAKEAELSQLRAELLKAQQTPLPPKKVIVDDTEPAKKSTVKKKSTRKPAVKSSTSKSSTASPTTTSTKPPQ
jgi:hypothetical protein